MQLLHRTFAESCRLANPIGIALVGLGKHAARTVIPALARCSHMDLRRIVVRDADGASARQPEFVDRISDDFAAALADPGIDGIYVATPLAAHGSYAAAALAAGKHLWCEKPVVPSLAEAKQLTETAAQAKLAMFEIDYYQHHRQFLALRNAVAKRQAEGQNLVAAEAIFTIPELPADDIRYRADLSGGALFDVGYYPLSGALALFGSPSNVSAVGRHDAARGVDIAGSAMLEYDGFGVHAQWAIGASYRSEISVSMSASRLVAQRAFAKPDDVVTSIAVFNAFGSVDATIESGAHDAFVVMLNAQCAAITGQDDSALSAARDAICARAALVDQVRHAMAV
jgi:NDP-hexose-3-ketoreductase